MGKIASAFKAVTGLLTGGGSGILQSGIAAVSGYKDKKLEFVHEERIQAMLNGMKKEELVQAAMDSARKLAIVDSQSASWFARNIRPIGGFIALSVWVMTIVQRSSGVTFIILQDQDYRIIYLILGFYYGFRFLEKLTGKTR